MHHFLKHVSWCALHGEKRSGSNSTNCPDLTLTPLCLSKGTVSHSNLLKSHIYFDNTSGLPLTLTMTQMYNHNVCWMCNASKFYQVPLTYTWKWCHCGVLWALCFQMLYSWTSVLRVIIWCSMCGYLWLLHNAMKGYLEKKKRSDFIFQQKQAS